MGLGQFTGRDRIHARRGSSAGLGGVRELNAHFATFAFCSRVRTLGLGEEEDPLRAVKIDSKRCFMLSTMMACLAGVTPLRAGESTEAGMADLCAPQCFESTLLNGQVLHPLSEGTETATEASAPAAEDTRRSTAVALNYCRAALHRIRRYPTRRVLYEERHRILNNIDLNGIADEEVIRLYTTVLDEINQIEVADRERIVIAEQHKRSLQRQLVTDLFVIGTQAATGQLADAVRSGSNSWWDVRNRTLQREIDVWTIDRQRMVALVNRSSEFLSASWKLSRNNRIPDDWLIRENDLDRLTAALKEQDPAVRLRVLRRMSRFMECFPPYWYHVGRTEQQLGHFEQAACIYTRLAQFSGFFRHDDMLASGMANLAVIREYLQTPDAAETALAALDYSNGVWEANLMCAWVLARHQRFEDAEDAVLRNLDVELENQQSRIALVSLYYHAGNTKKLAEMLEREDVVAMIPVPGLLLSARLIGTDELPEPVNRHIIESLYGFVERRAGRHDVGIVTASAWKLADAHLSIAVGDHVLRSPQVVEGSNRTEVRFPFAPATVTDSIVLTITYPETPAIRLHLAHSDSELSHVRRPFAVPILPYRRATRFPVVPRAEFRITSVDIGDARLTLRPAADSTAS